MAFRPWLIQFIIICLTMMPMIMTNLVNSSPLSSSFKGAEKPSMRSVLMNSGLELDVMYRYSHEFLTSSDPDADADPDEMHMRWSEVGLHPKVKGGSERFLERLLVHDHLRRRHLLNSTTNGTVSLSPTNRTSQLNSLGGLHYAIVTIGTPSKQFLVALDTGSDLLWVPCQCQECATPDWSLYGIQGLPEFAIYSPNSSSTSKTIPCSDDICVETLMSTCVGVGACTYNATYLSANTSSSGYIVQDILHLNSEDSLGTSLQTPIYFGCGQVQTGLFLDFAPNGLFGLGPEVYSVPSTLATNSIVSNQVFSMCFNDASTRGRLIFGSKPPASSTVSQTPLLRVTPSLFYVIQVASFIMDTSRVNVSLPVFFDTGTSITILIPRVVKEIGDMVSSKLGLQQFVVQIQPGFALQYCWNPTDIQTEPPSLSIVFSGGDIWEVVPYIALTDESGNVQYFCLGILDDPKNNIIGYNFMSGYEYFFDQGSRIFSWVPSNCSNSVSNTTQHLPSIDDINIPSSSAPSPISTTSTPPPTSQHSMSNIKYKLSPIIIISSVLIWSVLQILC